MLLSTLRRLGLVLAALAAAALPAIVPAGSSRSADAASGAIRAAGTQPDGGGSATALPTPGLGPMAAPAAPGHHGPHTIVAILAATGAVVAVGLGWRLARPTPRSAPTPTPATPAGRAEPTARAPRAAAAEVTSAPAPRPPVGARTPNLARARHPALYDAEYTRQVERVRALRHRHERKL